MSTDGKADGWEQKLIVTFHARDRDMRDLAEDMTMVAPQASLRCEAADGNMVDVEMVMPDDAALLNSAMTVIFRAQRSLHPAIRVRRAFAGCAGRLSGPSGQAVSERSAA